MSAPEQAIADLPDAVQDTIRELLETADDRLIVDQHQCGIGITDNDGDLFEADREQYTGLAILRDLALIEAVTPDDPDFAMFGDEFLVLTPSGREVRVLLDQRFGGAS